MSENKWVENLRDIKYILDDAKVKYWLDFGTLLGAVRDGKFIAWDHDIDLSTMFTEAGKIIRKIPEFKEKGFEVDVGDNRIRIFNGSVSVDIWSWHLKGERAWVLFEWRVPRKRILPKVKGVIGRYFDMLAMGIQHRNVPGKKIPVKGKIAFTLIPSFADLAIRDFSFKVCEWLDMEYAAYAVPKSYYENLDTISFYSMRFNIPSHVHEYLTLIYGEDWMKPDPEWSSWKSGIIESIAVDRRKELSNYKYLCLRESNK